MALSLARTSPAVIEPISGAHLGRSALHSKPTGHQAGGVSGPVELHMRIVVLLWNHEGYEQICDRMTARTTPRGGVNPRNPESLL
jgi:hypothetical protein